jgi:hypothetical protein
MFTWTMTEVMSRHRTAAGEHRTDEQGIQWAVTARQGLFPPALSRRVLLWCQRTQGGRIRDDEGKDVEVRLGCVVVRHPGREDSVHSLRAGERELWELCTGEQG